MAYETFKVLLVDDEPVVLKMYGAALLKRHYVVIEAMNGKDALTKAFAEDPDIILLDIMMPGMDGYEVCRRLRTSPRTAATPIMILTSLVGSAARQKAQEVGADDYLTKGEPLDHVDGRIKMLVKQRIVARSQSWLADMDGSAGVDNLLRSWLKEGSPLAVSYIDINGLEAFEIATDFAAGERVLWQLARILLAQIKDEGQGSHVGYCGQDDFVLLCTPERAEPLARSTIRAFDALMREWKSGAGANAKTPSISIGIVLVEAGRSPHPGHVAHLGRSLLRQAKAAEGSAYRIARL